MPDVLRLLVTEIGCTMCGESVEFMCATCQQKICRHCVRYRGEQILCPPCDDNDGEH